jgi:Transposase IS4
VNAFLLLLLSAKIDFASDPSSEELIEPTNTSIPRALEDILHEFEPIEQVIYTPFQTEQPRRPATALLPPTFPTDPHPFDYFTLFFTRDLFQTITTNTNRYTNKQRIHAVKEGMREWSDLLIEELYVFIGVIIYMGIHIEPQISMY